MSNAQNIIIKRKKRINKAQMYENNFIQWVEYWRKNPHRFITDYLGLELYDFQKILIYQMNHHNNFIFVASRGLAKSTLSLLFAVQRSILYPKQKIIIVAPTKEQAGRFIRKISDFMAESENLRAEISEVHTTINNYSIDFHNGSTIFALPYSENALGVRGNILIVDEFVRTDKAVIGRVFVPMLTDVRRPRYIDLSAEERRLIPTENNRQLYLSSIRGADEWSYKYFEQYLSFMANDDERYSTIVLPYQFGVKHGFINRDIVDQSFNENKESLEMLLAEYSAIPERGTNNSFYKYSAMSRCQTNTRALFAMSDYEYVEYKDHPEKWKFHQEKLPNEVRVMAADIALIESPNNDNTAIWIIRLIPDGDGFRKIGAYCESLHGINAIIQGKRLKQLFYEMQCDWIALDVQGVGSGVYDIVTVPIYDEARDVTYPAWTVRNPEDVKMANRAIQMGYNAVPVIYAVKTPPELLYNMNTNMRNIIDKREIDLLCETDAAISYLDTKFEYYNIEDYELRARLLNSYAQTQVFINEAINLEQSVQGGYVKLKEKSGRRKDRVMALTYGMYFIKILEDELRNNTGDNTILDWLLFA